MNHQLQIKGHIKSRLEQWKEVPFQEIILERMTGITNQTYKISAAKGNVSPIIYRKFGESTENVYLERDSEIFIYEHVAQSGLGPKIFYYDTDVRLQEFIESSVLPASKMLSPGHLEEVAFALSKFHQLKPNSQKISHHSMIKRVFSDQMDRILTACHKKMDKDIYTAEQQELIKLFRSWVTPQQIQYVLKITAEHQKQPLVFSHNDLLANNVLIKKSTGQFIFIDYEYSCFNYPIYDIGNYFNETSFDYDACENPPYFGILPEKTEDQAMKRRFIEAYVVAKDITREQFKEKFEQLRKEEKYQAEISKLWSLVPLGQLLSNIMWGWWGIIVCKNPQIKFDYLAYVKRRYEEYYRLKKLL